jgi:hypothetical protein
MKILAICARTKQAIIMTLMFPFYKKRFAKWIAGRENKKFVVNK